VTWAASPSRAALSFILKEKVRCFFCPKRFAGVVLTCALLGQLQEAFAFELSGASSEAKGQSATRHQRSLREIIDLPWNVRIGAADIRPVNAAERQRRSSGPFLNLEPRRDAAEVGDLRVTPAAVHKD